MRTTRQMINDRITDIAQLTGMSTNRQDAINNGQSTYLATEYASAYGGYRLVQISVTTGATFGAFGFSDIEPRQPTYKFYNTLRGIIGGLRHATKTTALIGMLLAVTFAASACEGKTPKRFNEYINTEGAHTRDAEDKETFIYQIQVCAENIDCSAVYSVDEVKTFLLYQIQHNKQLTRKERKELKQDVLHSYSYLKY